MHWRQTFVSLALLAAFCGYLAAVSHDDQPAAAAQVKEADAAILLSRPAVPEPAVDEEDPPFAAKPVPEPPDEAVPAATPEAAAPTPEPAAPSEPAYREVSAIVTAYCPCARCCGRSADGKTSTNTSAWRRGAAAEPTAVPYGTLIYVEGYGYAVVDDTGNAMRRTWRRHGMIHVDLRMTYHYEARQWGYKVMKIRIYDKAP
jgi:3D (Asp-Asp-Asp) domain-containing protein